MTKIRDLIWNTITDSAKTKFDYSSFANDFDEIDENLAENILFKIIVGFANAQSSNAISSDLFNQMMMMGIIWEKNEINQFLEGKDKLLKLEIYTAQLANTLLQDGNEPTFVLQSIRKLLN